MSTDVLADAVSLLREAVSCIREGASDGELRAVLVESRELTRLVGQLQVEAVAGLVRSGAFAAAGYHKPESAVANVLTVDRRDAVEVVRAAERVSELPSTAAVFAAGAASVRQVNVIGQLLDSA